MLACGAVFEFLQNRDRNLAKCWKRGPVVVVPVALGMRYCKFVKKAKKAKKARAAPALKKTGGLPRSAISSSSPLGMVALHLLQQWKKSGRDGIVFLAGEENRAERLASIVHSLDRSSGVLVFPRLNNLPFDGLEFVPGDCRQTELGIAASCQGEETRLPAVDGGSDHGAPAATGKFELPERSS